MYLNEPRVPAGLARKLYRPYSVAKVVRKLSDLTYVVMDLRTEVEHRVNIKRLKQAHSDDESSEYSSTSNAENSDASRPLHDAASSSSDNENNASSYATRKRKTRIPVKTRAGRTVKMPAKYNDFVVLK